MLLIGGYLTIMHLFSFISSSGIPALLITSTNLSCFTLSCCIKTYINGLLSLVVVVLVVVVVAVVYKGLSTLLLNHLLNILQIHQINHTNMKKSDYTINRCYLPADVRL